MISNQPNSPMPIEPLTTEWNGYWMSFHPHEIISSEQPISAVLVIAMQNGKFLLADIPDRGWCIPSGHVESGETAEQAARRETYEETGAIVGECVPLGCYHMERNGVVKFAPVFAAQVIRQDPLPLSESNGTCLAAFEDLARIYHIWNPCIEQAFVMAQQALER